MINLLVPVVEDPENYATFVNDFLTKNKGAKIFVGIRTSLVQNFKAKKSKNIQVLAFDDKAKKEEIINSLHSCNLEKGKILIARRTLDADECEKLLSSAADITTLKAHHNKFVSFFKKMATKIIQKIFALSFFEDISAICYSENMFELVSVCANLSMATRINKYVGVDLSEIETKHKPVKSEYSKLKTILLFCLWQLLFLGSVAGGTCVCVFASSSALVVVAVIAWIAIALMFFLAGLFNFIRTINVGDLHYGKAQQKI